MVSNVTLAHEGEHPGVSFTSPRDGATVGQDVEVVMSVQGMRVEPAGEAVEGAGHHHLIIDGHYEPKGEAVPKDEKHLHFGKGETETSVHLTPGTHSLTLQFADGLHRSYGLEMSKTIVIQVK